MATAEAAVAYEEDYRATWQAPTQRPMDRDLGLRRLKIEPFEPVEMGYGGSEVVERLYQKRKARPRHSGYASTEVALHNRGFADFIFSVFPSIAFSFAILGMIAVVISLVDNRPAYLIPGFVAVLGFIVLGSVAVRIATLMRKANN